MPSYGNDLCYVCGYPILYVQEDEYGSGCCGNEYPNSNIKQFIDGDEVAIRKEYMVDSEEEFQKLIVLSPEHQYIKQTAEFLVNGAPSAPPMCYSYTGDRHANPEQLKQEAARIYQVALSLKGPEKRQELDRETLWMTKAQVIQRKDDDGDTPELRFIRIKDSCEDLMGRVRDADGNIYDAWGNNRFAHDSCLEVARQYVHADSSEDKLNTIQLWQIFFQKPDPRVMHGQDHFDPFIFYAAGSEVLIFDPLGTGEKNRENYQHLCDKIGDELETAP